MDAGLGIGSAANLVGGIMQSIAASKASQAMHQAFLDEMARQQGYRTQAFGTLEGALPTRGVETARQQIAQGAQNREQFYNKFASTPLALGSGPTAREKAAYSLAGTARGNLGGYSDWQLQQTIHQIRLQDELNKISNFAGGTASVFPYKMYDAQHSMDELAAWGNLISSIGGGAQSWGSLFGTPPTQQSTYGLMKPAPAETPPYNMSVSF